MVHCQNNLCDTMRNKRQNSAARQSLGLVQRVKADRQLQSEIDKAMASLLGGLPCAVDLRLARVLDTVLVASWTEHVSFQDEVLFPLIGKAERRTPDVRALIGRLENEHAEIAEYHDDFTASLKSIIAGRRISESGLEITLKRTLDLRSLHNGAEAVLDQIIPSVVDATDHTELEKWMASNGTASFPVNLILDLWE